MIIFVVFLLFLIVYLLLTKLENANAQLLDMNTSLIKLSNHERMQISHNLHDGIGQMLSGANFMLTAIQPKLSSGSAQIISPLKEATDIVANALRQTRILARGIRPDEKGENSMGKRLEEFMLNTQNQLGVKFSYIKTEALLRDLSLSEQHELYFIVVEAINNAIRHGKATEIMVQLIKKEGLELLVVDDGIGFEKIIDDGVRPGIGVKIMSYRARSIGWNMDFLKNVQGGTTVRCRENSNRIKKDFEERK